MLYQNIVDGLEVASKENVLLAIGLDQKNVVFDEVKINGIVFI